MWLISSLWKMVWRFHPTRALPLERFRPESLMFSPPCLRLDLFKHLIVMCPCSRITCPLMSWYKRLEHPIIRFVEGLPACHLLIWTTLVANILTVQQNVCKSLWIIMLFYMYFFFFFCSFYCPCYFWGFLCY